MLIFFENIHLYPSGRARKDNKYQRPKDNSLKRFRLLLSFSYFQPSLVYLYVYEAPTFICISRFFQKQVTFRHWHELHVAKKCIKWKVSIWKGLRHPRTQPSPTTTMSNVSFKASSSLCNKISLVRMAYVSHLYFSVSFWLSFFCMCHETKTCGNSHSQNPQKVN